MANLWSEVQSHLLFISFCVLIFAAVIALAMLAEHFVMKQRRGLKGARTIASIAMFSALSAVLMLLEIPLFFAPGFYKLDLSEVPVLICTFYLGPVSGVVCEFLKIVLKILLKGTSTAFVGEFASFAVGCSFVLPAAIVYQILHSKRGASVALCVGMLCLIVFGSFFNAWYLLPKFSELYGIPLDAIISMGTAVNASITDIRTLVLFAVVPFNLLKGAVDSILTFLLYKRVSRLLFRDR